MADRDNQEQLTAGTLHAAISHAVVGLLREHTGRGPTASRTTIRDNVVLVMLDQTLTKGEQSLVSKGRADKSRTRSKRSLRGRSWRAKSMALTAPQAVTQSRCALHLARSI